MTSAKTVLVPLDGSVHATAAIPVARGFGELLNATVALLHVSDDALTPAALVERMRLSGEDVPGLIVEHRQGAVAAEIVKAAGERHAAMIVMCPQIRTDLRWRALGSVAAAVLRAVPCPVVLVPSARGRKRWELHRLLVPQDGTPTSAATIGPAADLALKAAAELVVLHVATPGAVTPTEPGTLVSPRYIDQPQHEWPAWAQEFLARLCAVGGTRDGTEMRLAVAQGEVGAAVVDFARQSDLIVLGWRGALEPGRARTMQRVICDTGCPMIVLRVDRDRDRRYWPWSS
jgi:nucleotide-binding universal stress UspA family protein